MAKRFKLKKRVIEFDFGFDDYTNEIPIDNELPKKIGNLEKSFANLQTEIKTVAEHTDGKATDKMDEITQRLMAAIDEFLEDEGMAKAFFEKENAAPNIYDCMDIIQYIFETVTESAEALGQISNNNIDSGAVESIRAGRKARN